MKNVLYALILMLGCLWAAGSARADDAPVQIGTFDAWEAYSFFDHGERVCFMSTRPQKQQGKFKRRGEVFFFVTRWPENKDKNVVSISGGYRFKPKSQVTVKVNGKMFKLFTKDEMAWTKDGKADEAIIGAIQQAPSLVVEGVSERGTETTDTYSLKGSSAAWQAIITSCAKG